MRVMAIEDTVNIQAGEYYYVLDQVQYSYLIEGNIDTLWHSFWVDCKYFVVEELT